MATTICTKYEYTPTFIYVVVDQVVPCGWSRVFSICRYMGLENGEASARSRTALLSNRARNALALISSIYLIFLDYRENVYFTRNERTQLAPCQE